MYWILSHKKQRNRALETRTKQWGSKHRIFEILECAWSQPVHTIPTPMSASKHIIRQIMLFYEDLHCVGLTVCSDSRWRLLECKNLRIRFIFSPLVYCILYAEFLLIQIIFNYVLIV